MIALAACTLAACENNQSGEGTTTDTATAGVVSTEPAMATRTPGDGDVTYESGRVRVYRNNTWEDASDDVTLNNNVVVYRDGRVVRDGTEYEWEEGYVVDRDGNVWNRTGDALENAWDATRHGVKEAGKEIKHAADKTGKKIKDAVDGDRN